MRPKARLVTGDITARGLALDKSLHDGLREVTDGLKPEDRVVIAGLLRVIPGQKIDPQVTKIEQSQASSK